MKSNLSRNACSALQVKEGMKFVRACVRSCVGACVRACVCVHTRGALQGAASTVEGLHESCVSASIAEDDVLVAFPFTWKGNMT